MTFRCSERRRGLVAAAALCIIGCTAAAPPNPRADRLKNAGALSPWIPMNEGIAITSGIDRIRPDGDTVFGLTGQGVLIGVWDVGGVRDTHDSLAGRAEIRDSSGLSAHATHVAGTIAAAEGLFAEALGMAPSALLWSYGWEFDAVELAADGPWLSASNHAYGVVMGWTTNPACPDRGTWVGGADATEDPAFGRYGALASAIDGVVRAHDLVSIWAAGNERLDGDALGTDGHYHAPRCDELFTDSHVNERDAVHDTMGGQALAKNVITVGAVENLSPGFAPADVVALPSSSFGPADDGRIKPDLAASGEDVLSLGSSTDDMTANGSGTSSSAAGVTGGVALLVEKYRRDRSGRDPRAAELKALLIHTAAEAGTSEGPDASMGFGLFDAYAAALFLDRDSALPADARMLGVGVAIGTVDELSIAGPIASGTPLRVTLAWLDPPGPPNDAGSDDRTRVLQNDLDLALRAPDGRTTFFPWALDPEAPASAATRSEPNRVDTVEVVDVPAGENVWTGSWTVVVSTNGSLLRGGAQPYAIAATAPLTRPLVPMLSVPARVMLDAQPGASVPVEVTVDNRGSGTLAWTATEEIPWLVLTQGSGGDADAIAGTVSTAGLSTGEHRGTIRIDSNDPAGATTVALLLRVTCTPDCTGAECGTDPRCGTSCGRCGYGLHCSAGTCAALGAACPAADLGSELGTALVSGATVGATDGATATCGGAGAPEVAFAWTAPRTGAFTFSTQGSEFDTILHLRRDDCAGAEIGCSDDTSDLASALSVELTAGERVVAFIDGYEGARGIFSLDVQETRCPDGDLGSATNARLVPPSLPGRAERLAGSCGGSGAREQAFAWTAPATGPYVLTALGSPGAVVHVHDGTCSGAELGCAAGSLSLDLAEGQEIVVVVDGATQSSDELGIGIEFSAPACAGACDGTPNDGLCWCDTACAGLGDCCIDACENGAADAGVADDAGAAGQPDAASDEASPARAAGGCSCRIGARPAGRGAAIPLWLVVLFLARYVSGAMRRACTALPADAGPMFHNFQSRASSSSTASNGSARTRSSPPASSASFQLSGSPVGTRRCAREWHVQRPRVGGTSATFARHTSGAVVGATDAFDQGHPSSKDQRQAGMASMKVSVGIENR